MHDIQLANAHERSALGICEGGADWLGECHRHVAEVLGCDPDVHVQRGNTVVKTHHHWLAFRGGSVLHCRGLVRWAEGRSGRGGGAEN